jgi:hypothetical protein
MKVKLQGYEEEIEIGQFRASVKGFKKGHFHLLIYPRMQKILNCAIFEKNGSRWFAFPSFEKDAIDSPKKEYIPFVSFGDKKFLEQLKIAILVAIKEFLPETNSDPEELQW